MLKEFLKDSAIYVTANMMMRGIQLLLVPLYTRVLAPSAYGSVDMMMVVGAVATAAMTLKVDAGMARMLADAKEPAERAAYVSTALWLSLLAAALMGLIGVAGAPVLGPWVLGEGTETVFSVAALGLAGQAVFNFILVQLRFDMRRPKSFGLVSVLYTLVSNGLAVALVLGADTGVIGVFWGQVAGCAVACAIGALAGRHRYRLAFDTAKAREMLVYSTPLVFSVIGTSVAMLADRVAINAYMGLSEVGVYGIGARVASTAGLVLSAFAGALTPLVLARYLEPETPRHIARVFRIFLLLVLPVLIGFTLFASEIVRVLATEEYYAAAPVIPILTLAVTFAGMTIFTPGMELARRSGLLAIIMVVVAFENVGLNILLVPRMGAVGSALATLISAATGFAANLYFSQLLYRVPYDVRRLLGAVLIAAAAAGAGHAIDDGGLDPWPALAAKAAIWLLACGALAVALLDAHDRGLIRDRLRVLDKADGRPERPGAGPHR